MRISIEKLSVSRFNSRKTRTDSHIEKLTERIRRNGFEETRALWVYPAGDGFEVFAGGTRLEAARRAELAEVPCRIFEQHNNAVLIQGPIPNRDGSSDFVAIDTRSIRGAVRSASADFFSAEAA